MLTPRHPTPERIQRTSLPVPEAPPGTHGSKIPGVLGYTGSTEIPKLSSGETLPLLHLMVVDDNLPVRHACLEIASKMGFVVVGAADLPAARNVLSHQKIDVLLLDLRVPGGGGLVLLEDLKALHPDTSIVAMAAYATVPNAVEAMRIGAGDYLTKPFALEELTQVLLRAGARRQVDLESRRLRERLRNQRGAGQLVGGSPEMENLYRILSKVARSTHPVLIQGEVGTGKELVARAIHFNGSNAHRPFMPVDCGSLAPSLIEGELFGYAAGAFPGRAGGREGLLATDEGGTVFLREISELPLELQGKLMRALQQKEVYPIGASVPAPITVRVLAASSRNLSLLVEQGRFRRDLYFRLNVVNLRIPPLRDRREDIGLLALHFLDKAHKETGTRCVLSDDALRLLTEFDWPGNVQELETAIYRACATCSGPVINPGDLPTPLQQFRLHARSLLASKGAEAVEASSAAPRIRPIAEMEKQAILDTIRQLNGDKLLAAKLLGIGKTTLYRKLKEYGPEETPV